MDRQLMAENGTMVVVFHCDSNYKLKGVPTVETRGFVYLDLSKKVIEEVTKTSRSSFEQYIQSHSGNVDSKGLYEYIQHTVDRLLVRMLDKRPLVTPVVVRN
jgi:mRNA degradation ribonuclease J1/J2